MNEAMQNDCRLLAEMILKHSVEPIYQKELAALDSRLTGGMTKTTQAIGFRKEAARIANDMRSRMARTVIDLTDADESELFEQVLMNAYIFNVAHETVSGLQRWSYAKEEVELNYLFSLGQWEHFKNACIEKFEGKGVASRTSEV